MSEYKDWVEQHTETCDICLELLGRLECWDHDCTSNCRRVGCNCNCGEFHLNLTKKEAQEKLDKHIAEEVEKADAHFQSTT